MFEDKIYKPRQIFWTHDRKRDFVRALKDAATFATVVTLMALALSL